MTQREKILNRNIFEIFPDNPDDPNADGVAKLRASLMRVLQLRQRDNMVIQKYDIRKPDSEGGGFEERHWSPSNAPVFAPDGGILYIVHSVEDVTERVKLEQERSALRSRTEEMERLRQSQRMEAMGQLAGGVAHDFNNILGAVMMYCDRSLLESNLSGVAQHGFEQIKKQSERAATLTRQLLAFSRKQVLQPKTLNLNEVVSQTESLLQRLLTEDILLSTSLASDLSNVVADAGQIEQIILNLVINARDAMPKGGRVSVTTSNVQLDMPTGTGQLKVAPGNYVMLAIRDSGVGMDAKVQARIFEPFFTTKDVGKGTGLGLATVYGIVSQSKGAVWVYSEPGKGTVFKVYFPRVEGAVSVSNETLLNDLELRGNERLLVVEDQEDLRLLVSDMLAAQGYRVTVAENGKQALQLLEQGPHNYDLVVTDVVMPEVGGRALADTMRKRKIKSKVLYLSGYTEDTLQHYGLSGDHPNFLEKPFTRQSLLQKIRAVLSRAS